MPRRTWQFDLTTEQRDRVLIVRLTGRLTYDAVHLLRQALATPEPVGVLVDLSGLDYMSGAGLAAIEEANRRANAAGRPFVLCGVEGSVRTAFDLAGLLAALDVQPNCGRGLATAAGGRT
jgi:anti-anti-sigma factor